MNRPAHAARQVHDDWWLTICGRRLERIGAQFFVHATENGYPVKVAESAEDVACGGCLRSMRVRSRCGGTTLDAPSERSK